MRSGFFTVFSGGGVTALLLVSASLFFGTNTAVAHDAYGSGSHDAPATKAADVEPGNEASLKNFVLHAAKHIELVGNEPDKLLSIRADLEKDGPWKSGNLLFLVTMDGKGVSKVHGGYPTVGRDGGILSGFKDDDGKDVVLDLIAETKAAASGEAACVTYNWDDPDDPDDTNPKTACAARYSTIVVDDAVETRFAVVGLRHPNAAPHVKYESCDDHFAEINFDVEAKDVMDRETLKKFVQAVVSDAASRVVASVKAGQKRASAVAGLFAERRCMRLEGGPYRSDPVYLFAMLKTGKVFFNGLDSTLEDTSIALTDKNGDNIWELIAAEVDDPDSDGFIEYLWDNPVVDGDEVRDGNGNVIPGQSPGESFKVSYIQELVIQGNHTGLIYGSGIYPADSGGGDGCAIAAAGSTVRSAGLNLFAAISFLFLTISFKRRSA